MSPLEPGAAPGAGAPPGLEARIRSALLEESGLPLASARLDLQPVLNLGGFVNRSFRVADGHATYFLKLASDAEARRGLKRWRGLHAHLERHYHAPRMLGWVDIDGTTLGGPLFEWIEGELPAALQPDQLADVSRALRALHRDSLLVHQLEGEADAPTSCAAYYLSTYHERFVQDLESIGRQPPPFVSRQGLDWMAGETRVLEETVRASKAFREPARQPTHGDCWLHNLLVTRVGAWYLLDWDELRLGDPVVDWIMLLGPSFSNLRPPRRKAVPENALATEAQRTRFDVYARASLLDWIIDPLADWVDADNQP